MTSKELEYAEAITQQICICIDKFQDIAERLITECEIKGETVNFTKSFYDDLEKAPFFLMAEVIREADTIYDFQTKILMNVIMRYSAKYAAGDFKPNALKRSGVYENLKQAACVSMTECTDFWKTIFELLFRSGDYDAGSEILNSLGYVPMFFQGPMGWSENIDPENSLGGKIFIGLQDAMNEQIEQFRIEILKKEG